MVLWLPTKNDYKQQVFATVGYCLFYLEWLLEKPFCDGENSWLNRLQYWYALGSVVLILRSKKWLFFVAP